MLYILYSLQSNKAGLDKLLPNTDPPILPPSKVGCQAERVGSETFHRRDSRGVRYVFKDPSQHGALSSRLVVARAVSTSEARQGLWPNRLLQGPYSDASFSLTLYPFFHTIQAHRHNNRIPPFHMIQTRSEASTFLLQSLWHKLNNDSKHTHSTLPDKTLISQSERASGRLTASTTRPSYEGFVHHTSPTSQQSWAALIHTCTRAPSHMYNSGNMQD